MTEEFVDGHEEYALESIDEFNSRLMDYLVWYNTKRVHKSLGNISPINYLLKIFPKESHMYVTYTATQEKNTKTIAIMWESHLLIILLVS